jgi:UDP-glucose 4-epimerase
MNCVIFGGGGFIGSAVADRLLLDGHFVRIFERPRVEPYRKFDHSEHLEWMTGDFFSTQDVNVAIDGADTVIHLISTTLPKGSNDDPIYDVQSNLVPTIQMLNAMVAQKIPKVIFISSGGTIYGMPTYLPIDEKHPTDPYVSYGITKLAIEKYLLLFEREYDIKATILRVANPFGERQRIETAQGAVTMFLYRALRSQCIEIWGDGSITRDYVYIKDVADAFALALKYSGPKNVFNISSGRGTSLNELTELLEGVLGRSIKRRYLPGRSFDVNISILDNNLARQELGWIPKTHLKEGIIRTMAWMKSQ